LFSDGSFIENVWGGAGVAYYVRDNWRGRSFALGNIRNSFHAEALAVVEALKTANELLPDLKYRYTKVYTDCKAVLTEIVAGNGDILSIHPEQRQVVREIIQQRQQLLDHGYEVALCWVKAHSFSEGNEIADKLAGRGSRASADPRRINGGMPYKGPLTVSDFDFRLMLASAVRSTTIKRSAGDRRSRKLQMRRLIAGWAG
jgi:ribonuclease HI